MRNNLTPEQIAKIRETAKEKISGDAGFDLFMRDLVGSNFKAGKLHFCDHIISVITLEKLKAIYGEGGWNALSQESRDNLTLAFNKPGSLEKKQLLRDILPSLAITNVEAFRPFIYTWLKTAFSELQDKSDDDLETLIKPWYSPWSQDMASPVLKLLVEESLVGMSMEVKRLPFAQYCAEQGALLKTEGELAFKYEKGVLKGVTENGATLGIMDKDFCNGVEIILASTVFTATRGEMNGGRSDYLIESGACDSDVIAKLLANPNSIDKKEYPHIVYAALRQSIADDSVRKKIANRKTSYMEDVPLMPAEKIQLLKLISEKLDVTLDLRSLNLIGIKATKDLNLNNAIMDDHTQLGGLNALRVAQWQSYRHHVLDPRTGEFLAEVIVDRKTFDQYYSQDQRDPDLWKTMMFTLYRTQVEKTLHVCRDDEKEKLLANYKRFCDIMDKPHDLSSFPLSGKFALTITGSTQLPKKVDAYTGAATYEYHARDRKAKPIQIPLEEVVTKKVSDEKTALAYVAQVAHSDHKEEKLTLAREKYRALCHKLRPDPEKIYTISLNDLKVLIASAQACNNSWDMIPAAIQRLKLDDSEVYTYQDIAGKDHKINIAGAIKFVSRNAAQFQVELTALIPGYKNILQATPIALAAYASTSPEKAAVFHKIMLKAEGLAKEMKAQPQLSRGAIPPSPEVRMHQAWEQDIKKIEEEKERVEAQKKLASKSSRPASQAKQDSDDDFDVVEPVTRPVQQVVAKKVDLSEKEKEEKTNIIRRFEALKEYILRSATHKPDAEKLKEFLEQHSDPVKVSKFEDTNAKDLQKCVDNYLEELRALCGLAQTKEKNQVKLENSELNEIVRHSQLVSKGYQKKDITLNGKTTTIFYYLENKRLVILHPATDIIPTNSSLKNKEKDEAAKQSAMDTLSKTTEALKTQLKLSGNIAIQHIIPEIASGRARNLLPGKMFEDTQKNSRHICLRIVNQESGEKFDDAYHDSRTSKSYDPRSTEMGIQNIGDDINCGRYVAAMTIQAAGLLRDGIPVTAARLKVSPAIERALHFNSVDDAKTGLENAYVRPLSYNSTASEIIAHNIQKILCLKSEYVARSTNKTREFHGTNITPFKSAEGKSGYGTATFLTTIGARLFGMAYSATEKLEAVTAIEAAIAAARSNASGDGHIDFSKLPKAARQGELGKSVEAIEAAQSKYEKSLRNR